MTNPPEWRPQPRSTNDEAETRSETETKNEAGAKIETETVTQETQIEVSPDDRPEFVEDTEDHSATSSHVSLSSATDGFDARFVRDSIRSRLFGQGEPTFRIGDFVVFQKIGQGGGGAVYAAYDDRLGRKVALKFLLSEPKRSASSQARLIREAQAMARLSHPNVVQVYSLHELENEIFLAMEIVEGHTLKDWLFEKPRDWKETLEVYIQAGRGLAAAHHADLIHRDFKPANVMIQRDGRVCVGDFGCASFQANSPEDEQSQTLTNGEILNDEEGDTQETELKRSSVIYNRSHVSLTQTGSTLGTLAYMAPEQLDRQPADERSDQYSFCVALYEGLYGNRPQIGDGLPIVDRSNRPRIPLKIAQALRRGLSFRPQDRFADMDELLEALRLGKRQFRNRALTAGTVVATLMATPYIVVTNMSDADDPCAVYKGHEGHARDYAGFLGPELADRLEITLSNIDLPFADETRSAINRATHRYVDQWKKTGSRLCQAADDSLQTRARFDVQATCLERRKNELQHVLEVVLDGKHTTRIDKAVLAIHALPKPKQCEYAKALQGAAEDRRLAAPEQTKPIRQLISRAHALELAGDSQAGLPLAKEALRKAQELIHSPLEAESLYQIGRLQSITEAKETLLEAADLAEANRHDDLAVNIWLHLLYLANREGIYPNAYLHFHRARAALNRLGEKGERYAAILNAMAYADHHAGNLDKALANNEMSLDLRRATAVPDSLALAQSYRYRAYIHKLLGNMKASLAAIHLALEFEIDELGPHHHQVARTRHQLGLAQSDAGEYVAAEDNFSLAQNIYRATPGDYRIAIDQLELAIGELALHRGNPSKCRELAQTTLDRMIELLPTNSPFLADPRRLLGRAEFSLGRFEPALASFEQAIDLLRISSADTNLQIARNLSSSAQALLRLGEHKQALHRFDQALVTLTRGLGPNHIERAEAHNGRAMALLALGQQSQACESFEEMLKILDHHPNLIALWITQARTISQNECLQMNASK